MLMVVWNVFVYIGAVFNYTIVNMVIWWFFHLSIFFYKIMFPFHSTRMEKMGYQKYPAIILTTLGIEF